MQSHTERKDNEKTPGVSGLSVSDKALPLCDGSGGDFHDKRKSSVSVQKYISEHPKLTVSGEVQNCQAAEYSLFCLSETSLSDCRVRTNSH